MRAVLPRIKGQGAVLRGDVGLPAPPPAGGMGPPLSGSEADPGMATMPEMPMGPPGNPAGPAMALPTDRGPANFMQHRMRTRPFA